MSIKKSTETFISQCSVIHNNYYNYTNTVYTNALDKVSIICPIHGEFQQQANSHLQGNGCKYCGTAKAHSKTKWTTDQFIEKAEKVHGSSYIYTDTIYVSSNEKVKITCKYHGSFYQLPSAHLKGQGCPTCGKQKCKVSQTKTTADFITKASLIHNNKYDYADSIYTTSKDQVNIRCPEHGLFSQTAQSHLSGQGCLKCAKGLSGWDYSIWEKQGKASKHFDSFKVYIIECYSETERFIKIGKTFSTVGRRFQDSAKLPYNWKLIRQHVGDARTISMLEKSLHAAYAKHSYTPTLPFKGNTECFVIEALDDIIISSDNL